MIEEHHNLLSIAFLLNETARRLREISGKPPTDPITIDDVVVWQRALNIVGCECAFCMSIKQISYPGEYLPVPEFLRNGQTYGCTEPLPIPASTFKCSKCGIVLSGLAHEQALLGGPRLCMVESCAFEARYFKPWLGSRYARIGPPALPA